MGDADQDVAFYQEVIETWEAGWQPAALSYLQEQRDATLSRLKLA